MTAHNRSTAVDKVQEDELLGYTHKNTATNTRDS